MTQKCTGEVSENWVDAHTPRRGSAQVVGYNVYSVVNVEIPPEQNSTGAEQHYHKTQAQLVSEAVQQIQSHCKPFGMHPGSTDGYRQ